MDTRKIINIFNEFDISSTKDESKYKISKLESITNLNHKAVSYTHLTLPTNREV